MDLLFSVKFAEIRHICIITGWLALQLLTVCVD